MRSSRLIPLTALVALLATVCAMRLGRRRAVVADVAGGRGVTATAAHLYARGGGDASVVPGLGAVSGRVAVAAGARVSERGARMMHGDARRTHRARGRGPVSARLAWSVALGGPIEAQVTASPDESTLYVASLDGVLTALARDGTTRWSLALTASPGRDRAYGAPCVGDDGTIYVGSDARRFHAVSSDGHLKWRLETAGEADTGGALTADGKVVFAAGNVVYAVRPGGDVAWRFAARGKVFTAPAITDDGMVVFGAQDHHAYAVGPSGALAWSVDLGADVDGGPAIGDDGAIFVGTDGDEIVRLGANGSVDWRTGVAGFVRGSLSVTRDGDVLAGVFGPTPRAVRLDGATGRVRGAFPIQGTGSRELGVLGGALEDDSGTLYFGAQDDVVYAVARDAGGGGSSPLWSFRTGGDVDAPLTLLSTGELIAASDDGKVYLFAP